MNNLQIEYCPTILQNVASMISTKLKALQTARIATSHRITNIVLAKRHRTGENQLSPSMTHLPWHFHQHIYCRSNKRKWLVGHGFLRCLNIKSRLHNTRTSQIIHKNTSTQWTHANIKIFNCNTILTETFRLIFCFFIY